MELDPQEKVHFVHGTLHGNERVTIHLSSSQELDKTYEKIPNYYYI